MEIKKWLLKIHYLNFKNKIILKKIILFFVLKSKILIYFQNVL